MYSLLFDLLQHAPKPALHLHMALLFIPACIILFTSHPLLSDAPVAPTTGTTDEAGDRKPLRLKAGEVPLLRRLGQSGQSHRVGVDWVEPQCGGEQLGAGQGGAQGA